MQELDCRISIATNTLRALNVLCDKQQNHPCIQGINVTRGVKDDAFLVSTNGHVLMKVELDEVNVLGNLSEKGVIIPSSLIPTKSGRLSCDIHIRNDEVRVTDSFGNVQLGKPVDAKYVDWKRVMPTDPKARSSYTALKLRVQDMQNICKIMKLISERTVQFDFVTEYGNPILIQPCQGIELVVMPARIG